MDSYLYYDCIRERIFAVCPVGGGGEGKLKSSFFFELVAKQISALS